MSGGVVETSMCSYIHRWVDIMVGLGRGRERGPKLVPVYG